MEGRWTSADHLALLESRFSPSAQGDHAAEATFARQAPKAAAACRMTHGEHSTLEKLSMGFCLSTQETVEKALTWAPHPSWEGSSECIDSIGVCEPDCQRIVAYT